MADQFDRASELEELERQSQLALHQRRTEKNHKAVATGYCLNCETPVADGVRWCDAECRDEWQEYNKNA